jgi:AraC family transcriptional regulator, transcriptional activator for feuABC-ybbA operon
MHAFGINFYMTSISREGDDCCVKDIKPFPFERITYIRDNEILVKYFTALTSAWNTSKVSCNMKCRSIFLNIVLELARQVNNSNLNHKVTKSLESAMTFIRNHYMDNIILEDVCNKVNLTPSYFGKVFKNYTGKTPFEYVHSVRIDRAEELLMKGISITRTSELVGFNDPFFFSKVFKKIKGCCPRDYLKNPSNLL